MERLRGGRLGKKAALRGTGWGAAAAGLSISSWRVGEPGGGPQDAGVTGCDADALARGKRRGDPLCRSGRGDRDTIAGLSLRLFASG